MVEFKTNRASRSIVNRVLAVSLGGLVTFTAVSAWGAYNVRGGSHRNCAKEVAMCTAGCPSTTGEGGAIGVRCLNNCETAFNTCVNESPEASVLPPSTPPKHPSPIAKPGGGTVRKH